MARESRRGQYAMILGLGIVPMVGLGAVTLDLAMASLIRSEADALAFSAAHTAIVAFAHDHTVKDSLSLADQIVANYQPVWGEGTYVLSNLEWGYVDRKTGELVVDTTAIEAAKATIRRPPTDAIFGSLFGVSSFEVTSFSVSNQIPSKFDRDGCDTQLKMVRGNGRKSIRGDRPDKVVQYKLKAPAVSGWYSVYKNDVAESGAKQRNESAYFRLYNDVNPTGFPLESNCGDEHVLQDYDNDGRIPERVHIGIFYLDADSENLLEMRHYCAIQDECPRFLDPYDECGDTADSVHFDRGEGFVCLESVSLAR